MGNAIGISISRFCFWAMVESVFETGPWLGAVASIGLMGPGIAAAPSLVDGRQLA